MINDVPHPNSPLGLATAGLEGLQAERQAMSDLLQQRTEDLFSTHEALEALPIDTSDLKAVVALQGKATAICYLSDLVRQRIVDVDREIKKASTDVGMLEQRRARYERGIAALENKDRVLPYSPVERNAKLAETRQELATLIGDPEAAVR